MREISCRAAAAATAIWLVAAPADAGESAAAFRRGVDHLAAKRYDAACRAFAEAEKRGGATVKTRYQLGRCNQERGRSVEAHRAFADAERLATAVGDDKSAAAARTRLGQVTQRVGLLTIDVPEATATLPALRISRDGEPVPPREFGVPVAVSPGAHEVTVAAKGHETLRLTVSPIEAGRSSQLNLPVLGPPTAAPAKTDPMAPAAMASTAPPAAPVSGAMNEGGAAEEPTKASPALFWSGLGFVIAGPLLAAGGAYTYVEEEETETGVTGMVVGGALLALGIPFMIYGGTDAEPEQAALVVGPASLGMNGTF